MIYCDLSPEKIDGAYRCRRPGCTGYAVSGPNFRRECMTNPGYHERLAEREAMRGITTYADLRCPYLSGTHEETTVLGCCDGRETTIEVGSCSLHGRCQLFGLGGLKACVACEDRNERAG